MCHICMPCFVDQNHLFDAYMYALQNRTSFINNGVLNHFIKKNIVYASYDRLITKDTRYILYTKSLVYIVNTIVDAQKRVLTLWSLLLLRVTSSYRDFRGWWQFSLHVMLLAIRKYLRLKYDKSAKLQVNKVFVLGNKFTTFGLHFS